MQTDFAGHDALRDWLGRRSVAATSVTRQAANLERQAVHRLYIVLSDETMTLTGFGLGIELCDMTSSECFEGFDSMLWDSSRQFGSGTACLAHDNRGILYVATSVGEVVGADVRHQLVREKAKEAKGGKKTKGASRLQPQPALDPIPSHFEISADGNYAAIAGPSSQDAELSSVAVLDLRVTRTLPGRDVTACSLEVAPTLFSSRPGLKVLQVQWHPESAKHFAVLSSDNTFRLFCVDDLRLAEQTFELQLRKTRGLGWGGEEWPDERAVAFAFSEGVLWSRFTVYILTSKCSFYMLCPVAPFGSNLPRALAAELVQSAAAGDSTASLTTMAWLQQAVGHFLEKEADADFGGDDNACATIQPHALLEHTPLLQGPLPLTSSHSELISLIDLSDQRDVPTSMALVRCRGECIILSVATAWGLVGWHLLTHAPEPDWGECSPNCVVEAGAVSAVHNQVPKSDGYAASEILLLAAARVGAPLAREPDTEDSWGGGPLMRLLLDPVVPEHLFCVHTNGAYLLSTPWILSLAKQLVDGGEGNGDSVDVRMTSVEELWASTSSGPYCIGAVVVGDALTGTALAAGISNGSVLCLRPPTGARRLPISGDTVQPHSNSAAEELRAKYGDILQGPRNLSMPRVTHLGAAQPEGLQLLTASITALKEKYVEYMVQTHHRLLPERVEQVADVAEAMQKRMQSTLQRLRKAERWNENLSARIKLLAELHWSLPHSLSASEARFQNRELPGVEREISQLSDMLRVHRTAAALPLENYKQLNRRAAAVADSGSLLSSPGISGVPPAQVRGLRSALAEQADLLGVGLELAEGLEVQLQGLGEARAAGLVPVM